MTISTTPDATTYDQLLDRIISDGIAEVREAYADPKEHHKRDGAIEGFEACRGKTPDEIVELWTASHAKLTSNIDIKDYWRQLQLEFVLNVLSVGLEKPLLGHLPTVRGALKYAEIVGVHGERASRNTVLLKGGLR